jgi:hypothetical protein
MRVGSHCGRNGVVERVSQEASARLMDWEGKGAKMRRPICHVLRHVVKCRPSIEVVDLIRLGVLSTRLICLVRAC